ncbi:hypothetical protein MNBD_CHLOROFLEXI01-4521 [hydrothermal vent metagenome]|uniref:Uncharacterized protein n=1 Tax=hydrothermal vent metagenome TaxID=652676 RepID=A0A3B0UR51_9ZZZZ
MIDSNIGQAGFRIGMFVVLISGILTWLTESGTAAHVISLFTLLMGLVFLLIIIVLVRIGRRP